MGIAFFSLDFDFENEGYYTNQGKIRKMLTCDVSNNLQVEQMCLKFTLLSVFCCSAVHNKHNNHAVKLCSSWEEGEDAGIYKGFPLLHLLSHSSQYTCALSVSLCFLPSLWTRSVENNFLSKEIFMIDNSYFCLSSKLKALVSVERNKNNLSP